MSLSQAHYESVIEMLRGQVPGLEILEMGTGQIEVRIRGLNQSLQTDAGGASVGQQPLVVVDGVPSGRPAGEVLMALNPQDVASISVLKDVSSTAVYGTKGANGVIIVRLTRRM
jgi:TonB-dependent SusC/RagA subfamily outer membrane receptor